MAQTTTVRNPFMLMLNPEVILAAVEKSERLSQLNRHLCRPLDRPVLGTQGKPAEAEADTGVDESEDEGDSTLS